MKVGKIILNPHKQETLPVEKNLCEMEN